MGTHNICLYKEVDKKYTGYNLKTMELLDCALIGVCAVIRSNTVCKKLIGWVVWMHILNKFHLFKLSEIFTILLWNINTGNLKLVKKSKKIFF